MFAILADIALDNAVQMRREAKLAAHRRQGRVRGEARVTKPAKEAVRAPAFVGTCAMEPVDGS